MQVQMTYRQEDLQYNTQFSFIKRPATDNNNSVHNKNRPEGKGAKKPENNKYSLIVLPLNNFSEK